ncbi:MAG: Ig-like domain-containing protein [Ardenticatenia bacterium]|nr:Ig-like domain-containing protein [Ardenticatenia bacterium]
MLVLVVIGVALAVGLSLVLLLAPEWIFAPRILAVEPADGFIGRTGTVEVLFNQRMDHAAVEAAFHIEPPVPGTFEWRPEGRRERLIFRPSRPLPLDQEFTVTIGAGATNRAGRRLVEPLAVTLQTRQGVRVVDVWPAPGADGVPLDAGVVIRFDRSLSPPESSAPITPTLTLTPDVPVRAQWLTSDTFALSPDVPLQPGTTYTVVLNPTLGERMALEARTGGASPPRACAWWPPCPSTAPRKFPRTLKSL